MGKSKRAMKRRKKASRKIMKGGGEFFDRAADFRKRTFMASDNAAAAAPGFLDFARGKAAAASDAASGAAGEFKKSASDKASAVAGEFKKSALGIFKDNSGGITSNTESESDPDPDNVPDPEPEPVPDTVSGLQTMTGGSRTRRRGMYKRSRRSKTFKDLCSNIGNVVLPYGLLGIKKCSSRKKRSGRSRKYRHKR